MPVPRADLRQIILDRLPTNRGSCATVQDFYEMAQQRLTFDDVDLGPASSTPSGEGVILWQRNLRSELLALKRKGEIVHHAPGRWRRPTPLASGEALAAQDVWKSIQHRARAAQGRDEGLASPTGREILIVKEVLDEQVEAHTVVEGNSAQIGRNDVAWAVTCLNAAGGRVGKGTLIKRLVNEALLVALINELKYEGDEIVLNRSPSSSGRKEEELWQASSSLPAPERGREMRAILMRRGQPAFRNALLKVFEGRCAITGCEAVEVLEAAHIHPVHAGGLDDVGNGLLLRSDIHTLFDRGLLSIDAEELSVIIDTSLNGTEYEAFRGRPLCVPEKRFETEFRNALICRGASP